MGSKIVMDVLLTLLQADFLIAADLRDHLHATEQRRGAIDKGRRAMTIRRDTVRPGSQDVASYWASKDKASACFVG